VVGDFARRGTTVARGQRGLEGAADDVPAADGTPVVIYTDVSYHRAAADAVARVEAEAGPIDGSLNLACTSVFTSFGEIEPESYRRVTASHHHNPLAALGAVASLTTPVRRVRRTRA
jgi:NADP-dependent 3-hydroxy acid dehydrogenase YdfG